jgi:hypothetical protein
MTDVKTKLGEELYNQVTEKLGDDAEKLIFNDDGKWIPKDRFDKINGQRAELEKQVADVTAKIKDFEPLASSNEELKKSVGQLQKQMEESKSEYENRIQQQVFDFSLETAMIDAKAKNTKAVRALLDTSTIKLDGDKLLGFDDQIEALQENESYLFWETVKRGKHPASGADDNKGRPEYGGFTSKTEFATLDPKGYAEKYPNG